ncbi:MAG: hypothetical protein PHS20_09675 [Sphaerochaetaceae bacterium]|nr:hypothetical protein [Sphaerochaetaceae bacterium]
MIRLGINSSRHLEAKMVLPMPGKKPKKLDVDYYFFTPSKLNVNGRNISREAMLRKFVVHGRYASPELSFDEILDKESQVSPLARITYCSMDFMHRVDSEKSFIHEAQSLANCASHLFKTTLEHFKNICDDSDEKDEMDEIIAEWTAKVPILIKRTRRILDVAEKTFPQSNLMVTAMQWADEDISATAEASSLDMFILSQKVMGNSDADRLKLMEIVKNESEYRQRRNYPTSNQNSENSAYRRSTLKKWSQSVLYLNQVISKSPERVSFAIAGVAAAVAMTFAAVMAIFANKWFLENSLPYLVLIITTYACKDRIKEGLRALILKTMPRWISDQVSYLRYPGTGKNVCKSKSKVTFTTPDKVPEKINAAREDYRNPFRSMLPTEDVVHYTRYLTINKADAEEEEKNKAIKNLDFITRIRMDDWLKEMDDSFNDVTYYEEDTDEIAQGKAGHLYHIHLIIEEFSKHDKIDNIYHYLVVMNRSGIVRTELISSNNRYSD